MTRRGARITSNGAPTPLQRLARAYGVLTSYRDGFFEPRKPSDESIVAVLQSLGAPVRGLDDIEQALRECRQARWGRVLEPVTVSWLDSPFSFQARLPRSLSGTRLECSLELEDGGALSWAVDAAEASAAHTAQVCGNTYHVLRIVPHLGVPAGYHTLHVKTARRTWRSRVLRAPRGLPALERTWGVFLPLYALHTEQSLGAGDLSDLSRLVDWVHDLGGGLAGILPLLATFPQDPSPYTPVSRLFWNEFYLDPRRLPEWSACPEARAYLGSAQVQSVIARSHLSRRVDFEASMAVKRKLIGLLAETLSGERLQQYRQALENDPRLRRYAAFRARIEPESGDASHYHGYAQWAISRQLRDVAESARTHGAGLYLDLPLGVHPEGFDRLEDPAAFASGVTGGAPPDRFFSKGQNWGFTPLNPVKMRESGQRYFIDCIRTQMEYAGVLRIDHVMGLHRQYCIPSGGDSEQGAYVRYPADELYAVLCLEARRNGTAVVGEDLGTVPQHVRGRMHAHGLQRMYVAQFEMKPDALNALPAPPRDAVASLNTHDTPTFASFWNGDDIREQQALGLLETQHAEAAADHRRKLKQAACRHFQQPRKSAAKTILENCLYALGASQAACLIVNIEDLWGERMPQNTPGANPKKMNWSRRARYSFEEFSRDSTILGILAKVAGFRKSKGAGKHNHG